MIEQQRVIVGGAAKAAGPRRIGLVAADMKIRGRIERLIEFQDQVGQELAGRRVGQTPGPAVRLKKGLKLGMEIQGDVLPGTAAGLRGVAEEVHLRDECHPHRAGCLHETADLLAVNRVVGPAELGMLLETECPPRLDNDVVELVISRQADRLFDSDRVGFGEPAQMKTAEGECRGIGDRQLWDKITR